MFVLQVNCMSSSNNSLKKEVNAWMSYLIINCCIEVVNMIVTKKE